MVWENTSLEYGTEAEKPVLQPGTVGVGAKILWKEYTSNDRVCAMYPKS